MLAAEPKLVVLGFRGRPIQLLEKAGRGYGSFSMGPDNL